METSDGYKIIDKPIGPCTFASRAIMKEHRKRNTFPISKNMFNEAHSQTWVPSAHLWVDVLRQWSLSRLPWSLPTSPLQLWLWWGCLGIRAMWWSREIIGRFHSTSTFDSALFKVCYTWSNKGPLIFRLYLKPFWKKGRGVRELLWALGRWMVPRDGVLHQGYWQVQVGNWRPESWGFVSGTWRVFGASAW